jgi:hypothetical protein
MEKLNFTTAKALYEIESQREKNELRNAFIKRFNQIRNSLPFFDRRAICFSPPQELTVATDFEIDVATIQFLLQKLSESGNLSESNYEEDFVKENDQISLIDLIKTENTNLTYNKMASYFAYQFFKCLTYEAEKKEGFVPLRQGVICRDRQGEEVKYDLYFSFMRGDDNNTHWTITDFNCIKWVFTLDLYFFSQMEIFGEEWNKDNGFIA